MLLVDADPQASLTISLGNPQPDKLPFTLSDAMGRILMDEPLRPGEGILHHPEGVDLMPADIQLSGMEVSLVNAMSRETILRQIEWSPSRTGLINPVAIFDPVELEGTTVSRASVPLFLMCTGVLFLARKRSFPAKSCGCATFCALRWPCFSGRWCTSSTTWRFPGISPRSPSRRGERGAVLPA